MTIQLVEKSQHHEAIEGFLGIFLAIGPNWMIYQNPFKITKKNNLLKDINSLLARRSPLWKKFVDPKIFMRKIWKKG